MNNILITKGIINIFKSDSLVFLRTEDFKNIMDSIGVAAYLYDGTYKCNILSDSLEVITAFFPNFGGFLIKARLLDEKIEGNWELWGHLTLEVSGPFKAYKIRDNILSISNSY